MIIVVYTPKFVRAYKKLVPELREEVKEAIRLFQNPSEHERLRVHKLTGRLSDAYSFSVNYEIRIVFSYGAGGEAILLMVGDHVIYR